MRKILFAISALIILACGLWTKTHGSLRPEAGAGTSSRNNAHESAEDSQAAGSFRTRVAKRGAPGPKGTHAPERLKEFMLPQVVIDGLTLGEALWKLLGVYEETCNWKPPAAPMPRRFPRWQARSEVTCHR